MKACVTCAGPVPKGYRKLCGAVACERAHANKSARQARIKKFPKERQCSVCGDGFLAKHHAVITCTEACWKARLSKQGCASALRFKHRVGPQRVKEYARNYYQNNKSRISEQAKQYRALNAEAVKLRLQRWRANNRQLLNAKLNIKRIRQSAILRAVRELGIQT